MLIHETTINCCKPNRFISFKDNNSEHSTRKVRYKHFKQMSDDVLRAKSVIDAHNEVQKSSKMKLCKAIPTIAASVAGASLAITQPGKLAGKAGVGLGFLAFNNLIATYADKTNNYLQKSRTPEEKQKKVNKIAKLTMAFGALAIGASALVSKTKKNGRISKFLSKEIKQLSSEINNTKLGKFVEKKVIPFENKHPKLMDRIGLVFPLSAIVGGCLAEDALSKSLSEDVKQKAVRNYAKGKFAQAQARAHFDSIKAQEV